MEFTCNSLNIKLTGIFKVKFCENYEKFIQNFSNLKKFYLTYPNTHTHNIFTVPFPVLLFPYSAPVSSSRKFPHKQLQLYRYILTPLHFCTPLAVPHPLFTRSQSTHTGIITNGTTAHSHSTALLGSAVPLCTVTLLFN
jgi:hypothetical protein